MNFARSEKRSAVRFSSLNELERLSNTYHLNSFHKRLNVSPFLGYSSSMTLPIGRPPNRQTMADRTARIAMVDECTKAFPKVMKFWLEALEGTATYKQNGQEFFKYSVADQFEAAKCIMEYGMVDRCSRWRGVPGADPSNARSSLDAK